MNIEFTPFKHSNSKSLHRDLSGHKSAANIAIPHRPRRSETYSTHELNEASFGWNQEKKPTESVLIGQHTDDDVNQKSPTFEK